MYDDIDYPDLIDSAMRSVVGGVLRQVKLYGLPGDHHFFISFRIDHPGCRVSDALRAKYPREMTIVVQHQFWDLTVEDSYFSITLSFNNVAEKLVIPFAALTAFADPSVKFGLQFNAELLDEDDEELFAGDPSQPVQPPAKPRTSLSGDAKGAEVISLDTFRKKK